MRLSLVTHQPAWLARDLGVPLLVTYVAEVRRYATEIGQLDFAAPMDHMTEQAPNRRELPAAA